jgi:hypothetical protein
MLICSDLQKIMTMLLAGKKSGDMVVVFVKPQGDRMLRTIAVTAALAVALAGAAVAAPDDYKVEARGKPKGTGSDLIVKVLNTKTGQPVTDAKVYYFTTHQGGKTGQHTQSRVLPSDGKGAYRVRVKLRKQTQGEQFEHFMVSVPSEAEPIHARVPVKFDDK